MPRYRIQSMHRRLNTSTSTEQHQDNNVLAFSLPFLTILGVTAVEKPLTTKLPAPSTKKLPIDSDWPSEETWKIELQGSTKRGNTEEVDQSDYTYVANTVAKVQAAVRFGGYTFSSAIHIKQRP